MKLSIIIPAYNVEQYIGNCLNSIYSQKIPHDQLEVIVVNDGSNDGTEMIVKKNVEDHPDLLYIRQENQGQSVARNMGLIHATGDYIWYVDADDETTENSITTIFSYIEKYPQADFLTFDHIYHNSINGNERYMSSWVRRKGKESPYEKAFDGIDASKIFTSVVPWIHVFKRNYLVSNNLFFISMPFGEDNEFTTRLFFFAKEVRFIQFAHYKYFDMRPGSLTTQGRNNLLESANAGIKIIEFLNELEKDHVKTTKQKNYVNKLINHTYRSLMLLKTRKDVPSLNSLFQNNCKEWRKGYKESYKKSVSAKTFSFVEFIRFLVTLYCPQFYKYTEARNLKKLIKARKW